MGMRALAVDPEAVEGCGMRRGKSAVSAAIASRDAFDGRRQIAVAVRHAGRQPVDLFGRFGWRFDFHLAAAVVENGFAVGVAGQRTGRAEIGHDGHRRRLTPENSTTAITRRTPARTMDVL